MTLLTTATLSFSWGQEIQSASLGMLPESIAYISFCQSVINLLFDFYFS